jgi:hypothetical protein
MAQERKQFNMRLDDETAARIERLRVAEVQRLGMPVNNADLFRLALAALEREHGEPKGKRAKS